MLHQTCEALVPVAIGVVVDEAVRTGDGTSVVVSVLAVLALFAVLATAGAYAFWTIDVAQFAEAHLLRTAVARAVLRDPAVLRERQVGEVLSVATSDTRHAAEALGLLSFGVSGCVGTLVAAVVLLRIDLALGLGLLVRVPVLVLGLQALAPRLEARVHTRQRSAGLAAAVAADLLAGLRPLRGFGGVPEAVRRYRTASRTSRDAAVQAAGATSVLVGAGALATGAVLVATAAVAGTFVQRGRLDVGEFVTVVGMASFVADPVRNVSQCVQQLAVSRAGARRVAAVLAARPAPAGVLPAPPVRTLAGELLGVVTTGTTTADAVTAAFAGAGSGDGGGVLVEPAETHLLGDTLADALDTGPPPPGRGVALDVALRAVAAPDDLTTPLADGGGNFSGGQRQRIGLARALAADPEVLVLRDPTTALDAVTEDRVAAGLSADPHALPVATGRRSAAALARTATAHPRELTAAVVTTALASAGTVVLPLLLGRAVDAVRTGSSLTPVLVQLAVAAAVTAVVTALARRDAERLGADVAADLRERVVERSLRMPPRVLERAGAGDVASRVTEDVELFTSSVPLGATVLTSGLTVLLSPARRQQLAPARVVLRDPPVVVLDEATAEAGSAGARDLEQAALAVVAGRTAVVVAHRLSQAAVCDAVAVVERGEVVELGSHAELLALGGRYARLWGTWSHPPVTAGP